VAQLVIVSIAGAMTATLIVRALGSSTGRARSDEPVDAVSLPLPLPTAARGAAPLEPSTATAAPARAGRDLDATLAAPRLSLPDAPSLEQRATSVKSRMAERLELQSGEAYANGLAKSGLSRADSDAIARRFFADVAECAFEGARKQYAAAGTDFAELVAGAERVWSQENDAGIGVEVVAMREMPCVADAAQRAGIVLPPDLVARYAARVPDELSRSAAEFPHAARPPWADAMEAAIRAHLARYPSVALTSLYAECKANGCSVVIQGRDIPIFDLEFDVFAERNGFDHALVSGDDARRVVWLQR
jgi:hypothetical protein